MPAETMCSHIAAVAAALTGRCIDAGRFRPADPMAVAWQLWAATHGTVSGVLSGVIGAEPAAEQLRALGVTLYVGFGDHRTRAQRSIRRAEERTASTTAAAWS